MAQKAEGQSAAGGSASESQSQSRSYGEGNQLCRKLHLGVEALERRRAGRAEVGWGWGAVKCGRGYSFVTV